MLEHVAGAREYSNSLLKVSNSQDIFREVALIDWWEKNRHRFIKDVPAPPPAVKPVVPIVEFEYQAYKLIQARILTYNNKQYKLETRWKSDDNRYGWTLYKTGPSAKYLVSSLANKLGETNPQYKENVWRAYNAAIAPPVAPPTAPAKRKKRKIKSWHVTLSNGFNLSFTTTKNKSVSSLIRPALRDVVEMSGTWSVHSYRGTGVRNPVDKFSFWEGCLAALKNAEHSVSLKNWNKSGLRNDEWLAKVKAAFDAKQGQFTYFPVGE